MSDERPLCFRDWETQRPIFLLVSEVAMVQADHPSCSTRITLKGGRSIVVSSKLSEVLLVVWGISHPDAERLAGRVLE